MQYVANCSSSKPFLSAGLTRFYVETPIGETVTIAMVNSKTIDDVKVTIQSKEGVPPYKQRLFMQDEQLAGSRTLAQCEVGGQTLRLKVVNEEGLL